MNLMFFNRLSNELFAYAFWTENAYMLLIFSRLLAYYNWQTSETHTHLHEEAEAILGFKTGVQRVIN